MVQKGRQAFTKISFSPNLIRFCISVHMLCDFHSIFSRFWLKFGSIWCHSGSNLVAISHRRCRFRKANLDLLFFQIFKDRPATQRQEIDRQIRNSQETDRQETDRRQTTCRWSIERQETDRQEMPPELNVPRATPGSGGMRGAI